MNSSTTPIAQNDVVSTSGHGSNDSTKTALSRPVEPVLDEPALKVSLTQESPIPLDVEFEVERGELLALTGPSGSGKTTILRIIAGLQNCKSGFVISNGDAWVDTARQINVKPQNRSVGYVFQQYALFPHMTVIQNVTVAMGSVHRTVREDKAREFLSMTNMEGLEARYPDQLSGGQKQRVALARALARHPDVLLLDEPFSAVDQQTRERLYRELAQLRRELDLPMILVTHDMPEVMLLADSITLIHHGVGLQSGLVSDVVARPKSTAAARLLGHHNLFEAIVMATTPSETRLKVLNAELSVAPSSLDVGEKVVVLIPPSAIILHRRDRPSRGERENPVSGVVIEALALGDELLIKLEFQEGFFSDGLSNPKNPAPVPTVNRPMSFRVSRHVAARNGIETGATATVSILTEGIHIIRP